MARFALPVCTFAAVAIAGCTTYYDPPPPAKPVTVTSGTASAPAAGAVPAPAAPVSAARAGIIESISLVSIPTPTSAAAGGTLPAVVSGPYRVTLRLDDGSIQTMMVDNRAFLVGDRVQIMPDGKLNRL